MLCPRRSSNVSKPLLNVHEQSRSLNPSTGETQLYILLSETDNLNMLDQCFSIFFVSRHPFLVIYVFNGTPRWRYKHYVNENIITGSTQIGNYRGRHLTCVRLLEIGIVSRLATNAILINWMSGCKKVLTLISDPESRMSHKVQRHQHPLRVEIPTLSWPSQGIVWRPHSSSSDRSRQNSRFFPPHIQPYLQLGDDA